MLVASGSADHKVYIYDISGTIQVRIQEKYIHNQLIKILIQGNGTLIQQLEGHTDRVYGVNFHPSEPLLVSASADFTLRIWGNNYILYLLFNQHNV